MFFSNYLIGWHLKDTPELQFASLAELISYYHRHPYAATPDGRALYLREPVCPLFLYEYGMAVFVFLFLAEAFVLLSM